MSHILITGASGFVGNALLQHLLKNSALSIKFASRRAIPIVSNVRMQHVLVGDLSSETNWNEALVDVHTVVHCAARVHVMRETAANPLTEFRRTNVEGSLHLACQAQAAGVKRFVFISSIKVNGEQTFPNAPFKADDRPMPSDPYGISKMEAEQGLLALTTQGKMEIVIIRPVLVYGAGVKGNFLSMMRWLNKGIPLPLGAINSNRRSMVALDNLVDLIAVCIHHPAAAGQIFLASDGEDLSTTQLLRRSAYALGRRAYLLPLPSSWLILMARLLGRPGIAQRLCSSLQVDIGKNKVLLGWTPPISVDQGLERATASLRDNT